MNLQDIFLKQACKQKLSINVFLTNGFQIKGVLLSFDTYSLLLECDGRQNLLYKHAISTIVPSHSIVMPQETKQVEASVIGQIGDGV